MRQSLIETVVAIHDAGLYGMQWSPEHHSRLDALGRSGHARLRDSDDSRGPWVLTETGRAVEQAETRRLRNLGVAR